MKYAPYLYFVAVTALTYGVAMYILHVIWKVVLS